VKQRIKKKKSLSAMAMKSPIPGQGYVNPAQPARANIIAVHRVTDSSHRETTLGAPIYTIMHPGSGQQNIGWDQSRWQTSRQELFAPTLTDVLGHGGMRPGHLQPSPPYSHPIPKIGKESGRGKKRVRIVSEVRKADGAPPSMPIAATRRGVTLVYNTEFEEHYLRNNRSAGRKNMRCFPSCSQLGHKNLGFCGGAIELSLRLSKNNMKAQTVNNSNLRIFLEMRVIPGDKKMTPQQYGGLCEANVSLNATYPVRYIETMAKTTKAQTRPLFEAKILSPKVVQQTQQYCQMKALRLKIAIKEKKNNKAGALATLAALASTKTAPKKISKVQMMKAEKPPIRKKRKFSCVPASHKAYAGPEIQYYVRPRSWHYGWIANKHTHGFLHYVRAYLFEKTGDNGDCLQCIEICDSDTFVVSSSKRWQQPAEKKGDTGRAQCYPVSTPAPHEEPY
jgi:hypothetical protein